MINIEKKLKTYIKGLYLTLKGLDINCNINEAETIIYIDGYMISVEVTYSSFMESPSTNIVIYNMDTKEKHYCGYFINENKLLHFIKYITYETYEKYITNSDDPL